MNLSQGVYSTLAGKFYYYPTESQKVESQELARLSLSPEAVPQKQKKKG